MSSAADVKATAGAVTAELHAQIADASSALMTELGIEHLRYPASEEKRDADWSVLASLGEEDGEAYSFGDVETFTHDGTDHKIVIVADEIVGLVGAEGQLRYKPQLVDELDGTEDEDEAAEIQGVLDALEAAESAGLVSEGPMMCYWYPVRSDDYDPEDHATLAAQVRDLPLCVVYVDGTYGLALTGGGMDLSWEIAEAFIAIDYWPPLFVDLPRMAGRGTSEADQRIIRTIMLRHNIEAVRQISNASRLMEKFPRPKQMVSIQQDVIKSTGRLPYPLHINEEGEIGQQELWQGNPAKLCGFTADIEGGELTLTLAGFWANPQDAAGLHPVFLNTDGGPTASPTPVASVRTGDLVERLFA